MAAIENYRVIIIVGETGSGKTTQLPQYLLECGWASGGRLVGCTQPRRVAAQSVAARVAQELGETIGQTVGFSVQFDHVFDAEKTRIKYMTDGHLVREIMADPLLSRYSVIMLDEAHERSLQTDVLMGLLKKIRKKRPDLRLIISSATLDAELFREYFKDPSRPSPDTVIIGLEGRQYPVDIQYLEKPAVDYIEKTIQVVLDIEYCEPVGDILVFLPGQEEIETVCSALRERWGNTASGTKRGSGNIQVLPMYSQLSQKSQMKVFNPTPHNTRKIVVATNIAETSITIDGIVYVVDSGFVKTPFYNPLVGMDALLVQPTSQAEAIQRAGRAGRVRAGKCFRLYTEETYKSLKETSTPEVQRSNLEWTVLQLKALGVEDIAHFDFPSPPPAESIIRALELLFAIDCISDECKLTQPLGQLLAEFPVSPRLGKALYTSLELGCTEDILTITSMLSVQNPFVKHGNSKEAKEKLEEAIASFAHSSGDHLTHLKVYNEWLEAGQKDAWCQENSLDSRALKRAKEVRAQLRGYMKRLKPSSLDMSTCNGDSDLIRKCMVSGFFGNAARLSSNGLYKTVKDNRVVSLHPSSVLYRSTKALPNWIIFHDVTLTSQEFIRDVSAINPRWLFDLAPHFYEMKNEEALNTNEGPTVKRSKVEKAPAAPGSLSSHPSIGKGSGGRLESILQRYR